MLTEIIVVLGILFLLALIIAPIYYFAKREKYEEQPAEDLEK
jgi:hypothetical protein